MKKHIITSLLLLTTAAPILAQESEDQEAIKPSYRFPSTADAVKAYNKDHPDQAMLSPITVTASASTLDELLSPKSVSIYSKEDIRKSGANSLLNFFKYNTSIQVDPSSGNIQTPKLSMRGFGMQDGYQNINIIVDGVSINQIDMVPQKLGAIPLQSIEKIEVLNSSGSVLYGDQSAAGTIIIHTDMSFDRKEFFGSLRAGGGTYAVRNVDAHLGSITEFWDVKFLTDLKFSYLGSDGKKQVIADSSAWPGGKRDTSSILNGKATWGFKVGDFEAVASYAKDDSKIVYTGSMTPVQFRSDPDRDVTNGSQWISRDEDITTKLKYKISDVFNLTYNFSVRDRTNENVLASGYAYGYHYDTHDHRLTLKSIHDRFVLLTGFYYKFSERANTHGTTFTSKENLAGFISGDFFLSDRLTFNAGFRQAHITFGHDVASSNTHLRKSESPNAYNAAINYSLFKNDALFFSYQHAYQAPDIDRFFASGDVFNGFIDTMTINTYSTGYKHIEDGLSVKIDLYYSDLKKEIYYDQTNNTNYDTSEKYGLDLALYKDFGLFDTNLNYTYTSTRAKLGGRPYEIGGQPHHVVLASIGKRFTSSLMPLPYHGIRVSHKYKSKSYYLDDYNNYFNEAKGYNSTAINYQLSDDKHWSLDFSVNNLFEVANAQFVRGYNYAEAVYPTYYERTFLGTATFAF
jgi:iron complex outermembrane receptor protein